MPHFKWLDSEHSVEGEYCTSKKNISMRRLSIFDSGLACQMPIAHELVMVGQATQT